MSDALSVASERAQAVHIRKLPAKGDQAVLSQLLSLEKRLFKKADNWGDLLVKETQRRNTFLLYAEVDAASAAAASPPAAPSHSPPQQSPPPGGKNSTKVGGHPATKQPTAAPTSAPTSPAPQVVAYIVFTTTGLNAHISKLAVAAEWRRRGLGRSLVRAAVAAAKSERRAASVSLHVDADNEPALRLYLGEGFRSEALLEDYYSRGRHAHKMRLDLDTDC